MIIFGILVLIAGLLAIVSPFVAGQAVAIFVGILLLVAGVIRVIWAFRKETFGKGLFAFLLGGITAIAGVAVLGQPVVGLASLTLLLAVYFFADGVVSIVTSFQVKPKSGRGWLLFDGIATLLLGGIITIQWPFSGTWAVGILVGLRLLFAGWTMVFVGSAVRSVEKQVTAES